MCVCVCVHSCITVISSVFFFHLTLRWNMTWTFYWQGDSPLQQIFFIYCLLINIYWNKQTLFRVMSSLNTNYWLNDLPDEMNIEYNLRFVNCLTVIVILNKTVFLCVWEQIWGGEWEASRTESAMSLQQ